MGLLCRTSKACYIFHGRNFFFPLYFQYLAPPVSRPLSRAPCMCHWHDLTLATKYLSFTDSSLFIAVMRPIMQFLLALLAVLSATVVFASPDNEKPQGLNLHGATSWTSLRSLFQVDTRPNDHESQKSFTFPSRISRRRHRARYHP
jgi:hypothetical protein